MFSFINILLVILAYLLGSIPTAVWIGKIFYKKDVRDFGSKNAGATNTFRVLGVKAGIPVLILDLLKGFVAVKLTLLSVIPESGNENFIIFQLLLGTASVIGHIYPVFAGFRGGKGVATMAGFVLAIHPLATLISIGIFIIVLLLSKYVSLSSLSAGFAFPVLIIFVFKTQEVSLIIFSILVTVLLVFTHRKNISRLLHGKELKAKLFSSASSSPTTPE